MMVVGEVFFKELVKKVVLIFKNCCVENIYGFIEVFIYVVYFGCGKGDIVSYYMLIGKFVFNMKIYIVD